tara:strand:+ start:100 stop:588 length:489 start_codon:yes stop_codon:yes gene_type:complete
MKRRIMENIDGEEVVKMIDLTDGKGKIGFTCSCFDLLHAGHIKMLQDARNQCDYLIVGLQTDPTIDRPDTKNKPIQTLEERQTMISAVRFIDEIMIYDTEDDLYSYLKHNRVNVRILGTDYEGKDFTGKDLDIPIYYHKRDHDWSTTSLRERIYEAEIQKKK